MPHANGPGGISIHAVDVVSGATAKGLHVRIERLDGAMRTVIAEGTIGANGLFDHPVCTGQGAGPGTYEAIFAIGAFYRAAGHDPGFLGDVPFRFSILRAQDHVHLPMKFSPWGYALFRGA